MNTRKLLNDGENNNNNNNNDDDDDDDNNDADRPGCCRMRGGAKSEQK